MTFKQVYFCEGLACIGDNIINIGMVRYLRTKYDTVYVAVLNKYYESIKMFYIDDDNICVMPFDTIENAIKYQYEIKYHDIYMSIKYKIKN